MINALTINAAGDDHSTLTAFDSIDGGAGNDTLNIYSNGTGKENASLPTSAMVKNVETINVYNQGATAFSATGLDASKFVGATAINQNGLAAAVTNLAAGTVAGFNGTAAGALSVTAADAATTAAVALTNVNEAVTLSVLSGAAGTLNSVTVSGTRVDGADAGTNVSNLTLNVTAGKDVQSVAVNTAFDSNLTIGTNGKAVTAVDASASTGAITFNVDNVATPTDVGAAAAVATLKTGAGNDVVGLSTALTSTAKAASVSTGAGDDRLFVNVDAAAAVAGSTVAVDAGDGKDTINLTIASGATAANVTYNVTAGAGDDTVAITGTVKTTDKIDGGAGTDTVSLANNAALVADDYIVFNKVLTNFETLKLTVATTDFDASQLAANYTTVDLTTGSEVTKVGAQALIANGDLTATAAGTDLAATPKVYAGTLNITDKAAGLITANADKVALTVAPVTNNDGAADATAVVLTGSAKSATVALSATTDTNGTAADTTDDVLETSSVAVTTVKAGALADLASLTLTGNGAATVIVGDTKLVSVDASGLNSVDIAGNATDGLTYSSTNTSAETIKLGAGLDHVTLGASTYGNVDVIQGLNLVLNAAGNALDLTKSDTLTITGVTLTAASKGFTTTQTDLQLALKDAAAYSAAHSGVNLAFQQGGNTYVFHDETAAVGKQVGLIDATDTVVQLTGQVNLDALVHALA